MTDDPKTPHQRRPVPIPKADAPDGETKPHRMTVEELVAGMTPDNEPLFKDDWPVGEEII
jgi:hypothetical protein